MFIWMTALTGIIYPLLITGIAQLTMRTKASGDFLSSKDTLVGAVLISQKFEGDKYFWSRPSSINYNPLPSGGSNLGPTSADLRKTIEQRREKIAKANNLTDKTQIPPELLCSSGSGLDPHISLKAAYFQLDRVAKARGLDKKRIENIIEDLAIKPRLGFLGDECVNVLILNITLDNLSKT